MSQLPQYRSKSNHLKKQKPGVTNYLSLLIKITQTNLLFKFNFSTKNADVVWIYILFRPAAETSSLKNLKPQTLKSPKPPKITFSEKKK